MEYNDDFGDEDHLNYEDGEAPFEEDEWEDHTAISKVRASHPGWMIMKIKNYRYDTFDEIKKWCDDFVAYGKWDKVGWGGMCSYTVAAAFEDARDALLYKIVWG